MLKKQRRFTVYKLLTIMRLVTLSISLIALFLLQTCKPYYFRDHYQTTNDLLLNTENTPSKPYLKAHLQDGKVYILTDSWAVDTARNQVNGNGSLYDVNRKLITSGQVSVPIDSVSIFETNKKLDEVEKNTIAGLSVLAGLDVLLSVVCLTNPKACFGSCPTFYINEEDNFHFASAEGFSSAISPSLEYTDIDALNYTTKETDTFSIIMKNEALETHSVNHVKLLAVPRAKDERIYHSPDNLLYRCDRTVQAGKAIADEGDITDLLAKADRVERFSLADENNLSCKEEIYLTFDSPADTNTLGVNTLGLLISFRQTQMTTYLFYSAMDYMGNYVSDVFAELERDKYPAERLEKSIKGELGGIDIYVWDNYSCNWELQGSVNESGPIAFGHQLVPLQTRSPRQEFKIKIVLNKGLWRIDRVGLTGIHQVAKPIILEPNEILNQGMNDTDALARINDPEGYLISMPGEAYRFKFALPDKNERYELFLQSKGYYLEWMRESWIKEKNLLKLNQLLNQPKRFLKTETKAYKKQEKTMEAAFWNSKIDTKSFTYYDH
jgi:hypothetical protein